MKKKKKKEHPKQNKIARKVRKKSLFLRHIILIAFTLLACYSILISNSGYKHLLNSYVIYNLKFIIQNPKLSLDQKLQIKLHSDYSFIKFIKENTPESAVILMPPLTLKSDLQLVSGAQNKIWNIYFLYPRKLVYVTDVNNPLLNQITHVMIVNFWGYDYIEEHYGIRYPRTAKYGILPISKGNEK